jgi:uncharacterized phage protein (TIGR02218 family)
MTYASRERSKEAGKPIELFLFELGLSRFAYTNRETSITFESQIYEPIPISRSKIVTTLDNKDSQVNIRLPGDNTFARMYIGVIPGEFPEITIRQLHTNDPDSQAIFTFQGFVSTVGFMDDCKRADVACRPLTSASSRTIPRHTFQALCNHNLYDGNCTQLEADFEESPTVASVSGRQVTISAGTATNLSGSGYWEAGFIQFGNEFRTINVQADNVMTLNLPFLQAVTGQTVRMLPGCNHIIDQDCDSVFSNTLNHGGFPYVPFRNPFNGLD